MYRSATTPISKTFFVVHNCFWIVSLPSCLEAFYVKGFFQLSGIHKCCDVHVSLNKSFLSDQRLRYVSSYINIIGSIFKGIFTISNRQFVILIMVTLSCYANKIARKAHCKFGVAC